MLSEHMHWFTLENITVVVLWRMVYREMRVEAGTYVGRLLLEFHKDDVFWDYI